MLGNVFSNTTPTPRVEEAEVCRYSVSHSAYALWPPLRLWPSSPARHFNNHIARRLVRARARDVPKNFRCPRLMSTASPWSFPSPSWGQAWSSGSNAQCEQFNHADSDHQHCECYGVVVEPMPLHDVPPLYPSLVGLVGRRFKWGATVLKALEQLVDRGLTPARLP